MEAVLSLYDKGKQNIEGTLTKDIYINTFIKGSAKLKRFYKGNDRSNFQIRCVLSYTS